jgi:hypothetical protein
MKNLTNKHQIVISLAAEKKHMPMSFLLNSLKVSSEKRVMAIVNDLRHNGIITYKMIKTSAGKSLNLHLTKTAYYGRSYLVA